MLIRFRTQAALLCGVDKVLKLEDSESQFICSHTPIKIIPARELGRLSFD